MRVRLCDHPVRLELSVFRGSGGASTMSHASAADVYRYMKASSRPSAPKELRELLAQRCGLALHSDDEVWREAATQVMTGKLFLVQQLPHGQGSGATVETAQTPAPARAKRPSMSPPPPLPPPRRPTVTEAPQSEPESTAFLEQDLQAAALEQAAVNGVPFCEVCEKAAAATRQAPA